MKISVITGGRMDYGHLYKVMQKIKTSKKLSLQIIATCMHLSPEFGLTIDKIIQDGFKIDKRVECLLSSDTPTAVAKSVGLACISFSDAFFELKPDLIMLMGDRFELLAAAQVALIMKIPIAHISGGDTTEGAYDESIRHSITKMSHIHFVTNKNAYERVSQLGENPKFIYNVGSPTIDNILDTKFVSKNNLEKKINYKFKDKNILFTYHPVTLNVEKNLNDLKVILRALESLGPDVGIIITKSNADDGGRELNKQLKIFEKNNINAKLFDSLGQFLYYNTINIVDCVVGNSSSGLFEVPTFNKPTVNIGDRQKGRTRCNSIIDAKVDSKEILSSIHYAFNLDCQNIVNPYGEGKSSEKIVKILEKLSLNDFSVQKRFFEYIKN